MQVFKTNVFGVGVNVTVFGFDYDRGFYNSDCGSLDAPEILCAGSTKGFYSELLKDYVTASSIFHR